MFQKAKSTKDLVHGSQPPANTTEKKPRKEKPPKKERKPGKVKFDPKALLRSKLLWGCVSIGAALILTFVVVPMQQSRAAAVTPVVILTADVSVGDCVTADMLTTVDMGVTGIPSGALTDPSAAIGFYITADGLAGDVLTSARLTTEYPTDNPFLLKLPEGKMAMAVTLSGLSQSVASKLRAGDVICLLSVGNNSQDTASADAHPELQAVEVLSVTDSDSIDIQDNNGGDRQISAVVLAVNSKQATLLAGLDREATLYAALVSRGDPTVKEALLLQQESFFSATEDNAAIENTQPNKEEELIE